MNDPDAYLTYLEVLDEEHWALSGIPPPDEATQLRDRYRTTRALPDNDPAKADVEAAYRTAVLGRAHEAQRSALCFSGGGIRSATFGLGVLQALAKQSLSNETDHDPALLADFDYLSTVSGGGYLGAWLSAWIKRESVPTVIRGLAAPRKMTFEPEPETVLHLRRFSNYLTPKLGFLSADSWALGATVLRNVFLNWLVLIPLAASVLLAPLLAVHLVSIPPALITRPLLELLLLGGFCLGALGTAFIGFDLPSAGNARMSQRAYLAFCLTPLALAAVLLNTVWAWMPLSSTEGGLRLVELGKSGLTWLHFGLFGATMHGGGMLLGILAAMIRFGRPAPMKGLAATAAATLTGFVSGLAGYGLTRIGGFNEMTGRLYALDVYACIGFPLLMCLFMLAGSLLVGLTSYLTEDEDREWWARSGGWLLLLTLIWPVFGALVIFSIPALFYINTAFSSAFAAATGLTGWAAASLAASSSTPSGRRADRSVLEKAQKISFLKQNAAKLILPAFLILFALLVAAMNQMMLNAGGAAARIVNVPSFWPAWARSIGEQTSTIWWLLLFYAALCAVASYYVNVNTFSLHAMYRLRLIRAYLGASNTSRSPHPFTGFDEKDNIPLFELAPGKPLHILNMAVNLVKGENLAWQQRKAAPFSGTRLHTGSCRLGYRRSESYGGRYKLGKRPISLGTAMTISGAAASPNMGYNSSSLLMIVMMLFNARLGWWLGNPRDGSSVWKRRGPNWGVRTYIDEAFGLTGEKNAWIYLSDGGHFENLGLYEAVLRRCKYIVLSDSGADPSYSYDDLGNAIRKIHVDLGIPIAFEGTSLPASGVHAGQHHGIARIQYSAMDGNSPEDDGVLVYIKPSLNGDEPADVRQYAAHDRSFPHQTTSDQFFDESQFESYRGLGFHIVESILRLPKREALPQTIP